MLYQPLVVHRMILKDCDEKQSPPDMDNVSQCLISPGVFVYRDVF